MADQVETTGRTVEEAVKLALLKLGVTLDEVDIKILDSGATGRVLGLGAREARIMVTRRSSPFRETEGFDEPPPPVARAAPAQAVHEEETEADEDVFEEDDEAFEATGAAETVTLEDLTSAAFGIIQGLVDRMGFDAKVVKTADDPPSFDIVSGDEAELSDLVGPRGDNLRAFGFLVNSMVGRMARRGVRVAVDVNGYCKAREQELTERARQIADSVRASREPFTLEAMPANERRMIHVALAGDADVRTYSVGEGRERGVVIGPKE